MASDGASLVGFILAVGENCGVNMFWKPLGQGSEQRSAASHQQKTSRGSLIGPERAAFGGGAQQPACTGDRQSCE